VLDVLVGFVAELRHAGLPVSVSEEADAAEAIGHLPLEDRQAIKFALGSTLVKSANHWRAFDTAFEVYFSMRGSQFSLGSDDTSAGEQDGGAEGAVEAQASEAVGGAEPVSAEEIEALLFRALRDGEQLLLSAVARLAVARYAAMEPGRPVGGTYYLYRTLRHLDLEGALARLVAEARARASGDAVAPRDGSSSAHPGASVLRGRRPGQLTALEERLLEDEYNARIEQLKKEIEAEIRRRLVADRGAEALARSLRKPLPEDVDFMHATREELVAMRKAVQPLTRKLATRLARKRRHLRRGALDFRSTMRHSLSYGGVPVEPRFKHPNQAKPEIWVIADVSGSVAAFARFTLQLVHAISSQFSRVRSFVFIDGIDEVTGIFERSETVTEAIQRVNLEADVVWADGHSDYGHALTVFYERWGHEIGPKASILLLGDARNNYHASQAWVIGELHHRARRVFWLNPEPRSYWGSGDSIVEQYAQHCDATYECRNLRQLEAFVEHLA
jgi:uncharacterized protein with von Willebrand factor type A (vWA) domain